MNSTNNKAQYIHNESGSAIVGVLIFLALALVMTAGILSYNQGELHHTYALKKRSSAYYRAEAATGKAVAWLKEHSKDLVSPFTRENFYSTFEIDTAIQLGTNEGANFGVPTRVKLTGTDQSAILVYGQEGATANFPNTVNIDSGEDFDPVAAFASEDFGDMIVRVTLVNAIPEIPANDFGPTPAATPTTDFRPVFRIDASTAANGGTHVYAYATSEIVTSDNGCVCDCSQYSGNSGSSGSSSGSSGSGSSGASGSS
ncbi:MAG: hypothetical protein KDD60_04570, partial [Bdellovibrionales bacterium]|nr:hypothetical protein [Bdellovibrionales bacterium]